MQRKLDVKGRVARPTVCADRVQQILRVLRSEGVEKLERFIDLAIGAAGELAAGTEARTGAVHEHCHAGRGETGTRRRDPRRAASGSRACRPGMAVGFCDVMTSKASS